MSEKDTLFGNGLAFGLILMGMKKWWKKNRFAFSWNWLLIVGLFGLLLTKYWYCKCTGKEYFDDMSLLKLGF